MRDYVAGETAVLDAARALDAALDTGDPFEIHIAADELLAVGRAREDSLGSVSGFQAEAAGEAHLDPDSELTQILSELDVAQTLLAAGAVVDEMVPTADEHALVPAQADGLSAAPLSEALDQLEADRVRRRTDSPAKTAFSAGAPTVTTPEVFGASVTGFLEDVVNRTSSVINEAVKGLTTLPAASVQPWLGLAAALSEIPVVGALARLGMRALQRAVNALQQLIPAAVREKIAELVMQWWDESGAAGLTYRLLGVDNAQQLADGLPVASIDGIRLRVAAEDLAALTARHERTTQTTKRIVVVLTAAAPALMGVLAPAGPAVGWLYAAAAAGFVAAVASAFWIGRDCLQAGSGWARVDGLQVILGRLT